MIRSKQFLALFLGLAVLLPGCVIGKTGLLFVTKTNAGLDVSTTPPTAELSISRVEGVVGPQFENGQTLPVMSSFKFANTGIFAPHVGSAFATGDAAVTMAGLYGDDTFGKNWNARASLLKPENEANSPTNSRLSLDNEPDPGHLLPLPEIPLLNPKLTYQKNDVRPVFFGTDTALGIKVAWSGMTGQYPDTAKFGYNRKEWALVPVSMKEPKRGENTKYEMKIASLLATLDSGVKASGAANLDAMHIQYFATGNAATLLAMQRDVRAAMLARLDPNKEAYKELFGKKLDEKTKTVAFVLLGHIHNELSRLKSQGDSIAGVLTDRMDTAVPSDFKINIPNYTYLNGDFTDNQPYDPGAVKGFRRAIAYQNQLDTFINTLTIAATDENLKTVNGKTIAPQDKTEIRKNLLKQRDELQTKKGQLEAMIQANPKVLSDAIDYFYH